MDANSFKGDFDFDFTEMDGTKGGQPSINVDGDININDFLNGEENEEDHGEDNEEFLDFGATDDPVIGNVVDAQILAAQRDLSQPNAPSSRRYRPRTVTPSNMSSLRFCMKAPTQRNLSTSWEPISSR